MNGLEKRYAQHLETLRTVGEVTSWRFEPVKLRLAKKTWYTPDFWVTYPDGHVEIAEVKGFWESDARVKVKVAAEMWHEFVFRAVTWDKRRGWVFEDFTKEEESK